MVEGAELAVIPNADHFTMIEQIDIANIILLNFMVKSFPVTSQTLY